MLTSLDLVIVILFFIVVFIIGLFERKRITIDDYWVNSRSTNKFVLIATVTSTYLGVGSLISNAGIAFSGAGFGTIILLASFFFYFLVFGWFFASKIKEFGDKTKAYTLPDFLEYRYDKRVRVAGTIVNLITYGLWLALQILGFGIFVSAIGGIPPFWAMLAGGFIVISYTTIGGLRADIRTDVFQFLIMLSLIFVFLPIIIIKSGGLKVITTLPTTFLTGSEFAPIYVFIFGFLFFGATNLASSDLWQRAYAGDTPKNVRWAMNISSIIVFLFLIMGTLFGVYGKALVPDTDSNMVVPELLKKYLAPGIFGLVLAGFFAAIMSSADTVLLIMSMTIIHDLYHKSFGKSISHETLKASRWLTFSLGTLALIIALLVFDVVNLAIDAISFLVALVPAVVFGFYWKKATSTAALWSIILGAVTVFIFLFIRPLEAFIPGFFISIITFLVVNYFVSKNKLQQ